MMPLLIASELSKSFGPTVALDAVSFDLAAGEVHALVGENGAGKSTLVKVLSGACRPDTGHMTLGDERYHPKEPREAQSRGVAMVYQELSLAPHLSVRDNVLLGIESATGLGVLRREDNERRTREALAAIDHQDIASGARVADLSPARRQLVEIARALAQPSCRVLILDEPTSSLSADDVDRLFQLIRRLASRELGIIYISHFLEEVTRIADRITVLRDGRSVGTRAAGELTHSEIVRLMIGRDVGELYPRSLREAGEVVLKVEALAGVEKPSEASFALRRGEVLGIAGLVGAGRTELLQAIFGLAPVRNGAVRVGAFRGPAAPADRLEQGVGLLSESRSEGLALSLSVADNMTLSRLSALGPGHLVLPSRQHAASSRFVQKLEIRCSTVEQPVRELSGGNQQKVILARLLHHDVDVFLLDEPTRGVDVAAKATIYRVIDEAAASNKAVLMVSSYLPELLGVCDRIAVMHRGRLGQARPVASIDEHQLLMEATGPT